MLSGKHTPRGFGLELLLLHSHLVDDLALSELDLILTVKLVKVLLPSLKHDALFLVKYLVHFVRRVKRDHGTRLNRPQVGQDLLSGSLHSECTDHSWKLNRLLRPWCVKHCNRCVDLSELVGLLVNGFELLLEELIVK